MDDHFEICQPLKNLSNTDISSLGGALGLSYPKVEGASIEKVVAAWLNREDNVLQRCGEPTWYNLRDALESIGQKGIAEDIRIKFCRQKTGGQQDEYAALMTLGSTVSSMPLKSEGIANTVNIVFITD